MKKRAGLSGPARYQPMRMWLALLPTAALLATRTLITLTLLPLLSLILALLLLPLVLLLLLLATLLVLLVLLTLSLVLLLIRHRYSPFGNYPHVGRNRGMRHWFRIAART